MKNQEILNAVLQDIKSGNLEKYQTAKEMINILILHTNFESKTTRQRAVKIRELLNTVIQFSQKNFIKKDLRQKLEAATTNGDIKLLKYIIE